MNTNWAKILLFSLLGFALGFIISCLTCGGCMRGQSCGGGSCNKEMSCHGGAAGCSHHGEGKAACCKGGAHGEGHGDVHVIVKDLERSGFQGDTTIAIEGGTVSIKRTGDSTRVQVEMKEEATTVHTH